MICALAGAAITFGSSRLAAQSSLFDIKFEGSDTMAIGPGGVHQFHMTIQNNTAEKIQLRVVRVTNDLPGEDWSSSICFGALCYDPATSVPEPYSIFANKSTSCELAIAGGLQVDRSATVTLRFSANFDTNYVEKTFVAYTSAVNAVPNGTAALDLAPAYPNPASSYTLFPVPTGLRATEATLALYNARGEQVAELSAELRRAMESGAESVRADLAGLPSGAYLYRMAVDGREITRTITIVR